MIYFGDGTGAFSSDEYTVSISPDGFAIADLDGDGRLDLLVVDGLDPTLQVLRGAVRLVAGDEQWRGSAGDLVVIPPERHSLHADEDSAVLLTVYSPR